MRTISRRYSKAQQWWLFTSARPCSHSKSSCAPPSGWCGTALRPCDRAGDKTSHDGQQGELRQHQPGQVRPSPTASLWWSLATQQNWRAIPSVICYSITFAVARGKEGIIDFVRGSELKVAKGKRGHLLVVSQWPFVCHVWSSQGDFWNVLYSKHFGHLTLFNLISLCRLPLR